ncbi:MAG: PLP-dependent aminotransferase family protein [Lactobacillus sp.]|jgi:DNA-binding transcriptional MocR family regulator|nr:PLP-dependent aminotransferase family protein [Lactobacillus sp.]MCI2032170.1 PLP-dependent aminotransferase family protein [Lactobacillus sp.]
MELAQRNYQTSASGLEALFAASAPDVISFAGGYPDRSLFPRQELNHAFSSSFTNGDSELLQYASTAGYQPLREKLAARMTRDGINADAKDVLLTQGAQQGIDLTARLLLNAGDGLVVEGPTYVGALAAFDAYQPTYYTVPVEDDGMDLHALQKVLMTQKIKLIYTIPDFQNPTGTVMSLKKRQALVALANRYDVVILEDGPYRDLRYTGTNLPPLRYFDTQGRVIFLGSFSKILAPSLRLGWLTASPELLKPIMALKGGADVESSNLMMQGINSYLDHNDLDAHIQKIRTCYREKKDLMVKTLRSYLPDSCQINDPEGGFFLWLNLPAGFDAEDFMNNQLLPEANVSFVPASVMTPGHGPVNGARLNFTGPTLAQIQSGAQALGQALQSALSPKRLSN